jgi:hypothetical protein
MEQSRLQVLDTKPEGHLSLRLLSFIKFASSLHDLVSIGLVFRSVVVRRGREMLSKMDYFLTKAIKPIGQRMACFYDSESGTRLVCKCALWDAGKSRTEIECRYRTALSVIATQFATTVIPKPEILNVSYDS